MGQRSNSNPESNTEGYVLPTGAQIMLRKEECASDMGQRSNYAAAKDAQIKLKEEECAGDMGLIAIRMTIQLCLDLIMRKLLQLCLLTISNF
jgi:hypothetical protein